MTTDNSDILFTPVLSAGDIPAGEGRTFEVAGRLIAIFFDGESYHAMDDLCPSLRAHHLAPDLLLRCCHLPLACVAIPDMMVPVR